MTSVESLDTDEVFDVVSRRAPVFECLLSGPKHNRDVREELGVSRSTAYKAITELENLDLAHRSEGGYELTVPGQLLFEQYRQFQNRIENICRPGGLLALLPPDTEIPYAFLNGADVSLSRRHAPNSPIEEVKKIVCEATTVKGTAPVVLPSYVEVFTDAILADELEAEIIYEQAVWDYLWEKYREEQEAAMQSANLEIGVTTEELPFALIVTDENAHTAAIVVHAPDGDIRGIIHNDTEEAYEWGRGKWEQYRDIARNPSTEPNR